ncbi:MAG: hypothetical protein ABIZ04_19525 [Opitutus sp.]
MNSEQSNRPKLVCRVTRWRAALFDGSAATVRGHSATCADCQTYFASASQLENALRQNAPAVGAIAPGTLESRIINSVQRSQQPERTASHPMAWLVTGLGVTAAAMFLLVRMNEPQPRVTQEQFASVAQVLNLAIELPERISNLQPDALQLLETNPLQTEIASVQSDAQSALKFLALNFLPTSTDPARDAKVVAKPRGTT